MAYKRKSTKRSAPKARRRTTSKRRAAPRRAATQNIRIVLEQPQLPFPNGIPQSLPETVGAVSPVSPRRARF